jgi:hypothetical protein
MFLAYAIAAIAGGTLLLAGLVTGGHHDGVDLHHGGTADDGGGTLATAALSLRFWSYFLGLGGGTGLLLRLLAHLDAWLVFVLALGVGTATGLAASVLLSRASKQASGVVESTGLAYRLGTMLLPASPGVSSQVRITVNNQTIDLIAVTDDPAIAEREEVIILDVKDGVARVTRNAAAGGTDD